jgi:hypothetical protein
MTSAAHSRNLDDELDRVKWHILRTDSLRASVCARAGTVLSTNALVIAGIALAFGLKGHKPGLLILIPAVAALGCVAVSVVNASLALVTIRRWPRQFPQHKADPGPPYSLAEIDASALAFEDFRQRMLDQSTEQILEEALIELWRCGLLHSYRYARLRVALRWLLAAICLLAFAITISALVP